MDAETDHTHWWAMWGALIIASILPIVYVFLISIGFIKSSAPEILLAPLLVIGVIALLVALAFTAVVFQHIGLTDKNQTLGLPEGSVRAVIALSLILIFMISAVFLYFQVSKPNIVTSSGITKDMLSLFPNETIAYIQASDRSVNNETLYIVGREVGEDQASVDIAKQIITTVSTLVVAVAGFYFGTKAVSVATGVTATSGPVIRTVDKKEGAPGDLIPIEISGKNFDLGTKGQVRYVSPSGVILCTDLLSSPTRITGKFTVPADAKVDSKWALVVTNDDLDEDRLEDAFTVKGTGTPPTPPTQQ